MGLSREFSFKDYDLSGSFLGEYYITTFCHANYIRYNITHKICSGAFLRSEIIHPDWLFLYDPIDVVTYTYDIENTHIFKNITCDISKKFFECGLLDILNNMSSKHNITSFESVKYFIELMGKNDSNVHFYTTDSLGNKRLVGNWFSGIFGVLIQPFFDVFVETVKLLLGIVADLLVVVIESLVKALGALIQPVADILEVLLKLIVSSVAIVESKILLLEYTLLFLFLMYFVFNNVYFASVVVIIFMLIFGITRRSPSLILPLLNKELNYFSLDDYYRTKFDYNYSINYHTDSALYTFSFLIGNYSFVKLN
ncbi:MAG: hypothetical protein 3 [Bactrocera oleae negev-like virus]|nr:MAG: hypothetical protein 3 [Bactrocera oleae negev-like virus]